MIPTTYSTICRQHSVIFIWGHHDLFAQKTIQNKNQQPAYACRHITFNGFTNICALWIVKEQKPEMLPSGVRIHPWTSPFWALYLASSVPAWGSPHPLLAGQTNAGKIISTYMRGPTSQLEEPSIFQPVSRTLPVPSRFLPALKAFANKV